jgi:hypothetical protein
MAEPSSTGGRVPIPDPTLLTTEALQREIAHLRELLTAQINDVRRQINEADLRYQQRYDAQTRALDAARVAADLAMQAALVAAEKAVAKAEAAAEKRFDAVSARVDDLKEDSAHTFAGIQVQLAGSVGRGAGLSAGWGYLVAGVGLVAAIVAIVLAVLPQ